MAGQADFINILREIRGSATPGQPLTDGIWYELTVADKNGNAGVYGDILAKYGVVTESAGTFDQAVAILENLNVEVTTLPAGSQATSALVDGTWRIGIPKGLNGIDGIDGKTPNVGVSYSGGNLKYTVTVDGVVVIDSNILNLDSLVDSVVGSNIGVLDTLVAKQEVLDSVATVHGLVESFDSNVIAKQQEINDYTFGKLAELDSKSNSEKAEIAVYSNSKIVEFNSAATAKINQYDSNHTSKLATYNMNDATKIAQYNDNHEARLEEINYAYADRIIEMIKTRNFMGIMDEYVAKTDTHMIEFLDTVNANYIYYTNGVLLKLGTDYTVYNSTTVELTNKTNPYDVIVQINTAVLNNMLTAEGILFEDRVGQANGIAGLDSTGKVPASQLPSYVDDVLEFTNLATFPVTGESGKIYIALDTNKTYRWSGSVYVYITSGAVDSVNGQTGVVNVTTITGNAGTATKLQTARTINGVSFDGSANISVNTNNSEIIKFDSGTTEGTDLYTFNGSSAKTIDIKAGTNVTLTKAAGSITISANDTSVDWSEIQNKPDPVITVALSGDTTGTANTTLTDLASGTVSITTVNDKVNGVLTKSIAAASKSQAMVAGGGSITIGASGEVLWSSRFIVIGDGNGAHYSTDGYFDILCPTSGTITGVGGATNKTATAAGIPLAEWESLYYIPPIGSANTTLTANFRVVAYTAALVIEPHWIKICTRGSDTTPNYILFTNGIKLPLSSSLNTHTYGEFRSLTADTLTTARSITLTGDVTGTLTFDGSANTSMSTTITANSVVLGVDTTGNYVASVTQGTGIAITGTAGEGWSPTIALTNVGTAGTYRSVTTDAQGRVTGGTNPTTVSGYGITDVYTKTEIDTAVNLKANIASPTLTGTPTAPTASVGTNTTQIASTAFVVAEINKIEEW